MDRDINPDSDTTIQEFEDDIYVNLSIIGEKSPNIVRYWVDAPKHHYVFTSDKFSADNQTERRAKAWGAIVSQTNQKEMIQNPNLVPIEIASLGQAYIAAYMFSAHEYSLTEIAEKLDLATNSVDQYIRDVISQRR